ncbi:hypothetical protein [Peredibacter starrii]|uniref:Uncharacterized protein n=1 Tax=Peredibacter starrii TaxID=28202 RepID=A0AAX4HLY8_9BACT|nr:hypothetical protein [Peredibacter starrii]WPU64274.1 hypothetical protein SOO65_16390 [Peredibacter starrii]
MKGKKKGRLDKHRGNPHGNRPFEQKTKVQRNESLNTGVSEAVRDKQ